jgi:hypothetical protein
MRPNEDRQVVDQWHRCGAGASEIARRTGIPRSTVRDWCKGSVRPAQPRSDCWVCDARPFHEPSYVYLFGLYLGDGTLVLGRREVYCLRVTLDRRYPRIIDECAAAVLAIRAASRMGVGTVERKGCTVVQAYWKHWPCVFPQHGPGRKHLRSIELIGWQQTLVERHPGMLLAG